MMTTKFLSVDENVINLSAKAEEVSTLVKSKLLGNTSSLRGRMIGLSGGMFNLAQDSVTTTIDASGGSPLRSLKSISVVKEDYKSSLIVRAS